MSSTRRFNQHILTSTLAMVLIAGISCSDVLGTSRSVPVARVEVTPALSTIDVDSTIQLAAKVIDTDGNIRDDPVQWSGDAVASVDRNGLVTGLAPGVATITATSGGQRGTAQVRIERVMVVTVSPPTLMLLPPQAVQLTVTLRDRAGGEVIRPVTWASDHPGVATVDGLGRVTAISAGMTAITATSEGVTGAAAVTVLAPLASLTITPPADTMVVAGTMLMTATPRDAMGAMLVRPVIWTSSAPAVATVTPLGMITAMAPGQAVISASCEGFTATATIIVLAPIAAVVIEPIAPTVYIGRTLPLVANVYDADGNLLTRDVAWTSSNPGVATVDANGLVRGLGAGSTTITATSAGIVGATTVTVFAPVASIVVTPSTVSLEISGQVQLTAVLKDAAGTVLTRPMTWTTDSPAIATVSYTGLVVALSPGVTYVRATAEGATAAAEIRVATVATVSIVAPSDSIEIAETMVLVAQPRDGNGNAVNRPVQWTTSNPNVATVDATGKVTGVSTGTATIIATADGKSGMKSINVIVPVSTVDIVSTSTAVSVGQMLPLSVQVKGPQGQLLSRPVQWQSSNPSIATVNPLGQVTGVSVGSVTITALSGTRSDQTTITVQPGVARIVVTASASNVTPENPVVQVTAAMYDAGNNPVQGSVTWSSSNTAALTVSPTGALTADVTFVAQGSATITAASGGQTGSVNISAHGPPTGGEESLNNLSWPTIFAEGYSILGAPVGTDAGLRPTPEESIPVDSLPFWYHLNNPDWQNTYFLQGGDNVWRAEWLDGSATQAFGANVYWGDNLTHHSYNTHTNIHVEVALYARDVPTLRGFNMFSLSGEGPDEIQGADGNVGMFQPLLFTVHPRLVIEKIDAQGGNPVFTIVDEKVADGFGQDGPGYYRGELNKAGKVVYGFNFMIKEATIPEGQAKYGWYRLNFILENSVTVGGVTVPRRVNLDGLVASEESELPLYVPQLDPNRRRSYLDIYISSASGGHGTPE